MRKIQISVFKPIISGVSCFGAYQFFNIYTTFMKCAYLIMFFLWFHFFIPVHNCLWSSNPQRHTEVGLSPSYINLTASEAHFPVFLDSSRMIKQTGHMSEISCNHGEIKISCYIFFVKLKERRQFYWRLWRENNIKVDFGKKAQSVVIIQGYREKFHRWDVNTWSLGFYGA